MRRDFVAGILGVVATSFLIYRNYYKSKTTYRRFDISPLVYKPDIQPVDTKKTYVLPVYSEPVEELPKYQPKYTVDINLPKYQDEYSLDTYMELPLETEGKTHYTDVLYKGIDEDIPSSEPTFVKYLRFQCTETRNDVELTVHVGGFKFFQGHEVSSKKPLNIWNPHTGITKRYTQEPWIDSDQRMLVFQFAEPVVVTHYEMKSSTESPNFDPVHWKLEGSMSGTYWTILDDRTNSETAFPKARGKVARYIVRHV